MRIMSGLRMWSARFLMYSTSFPKGLWRKCSIPTRADLRFRESTETAVGSRCDDKLVLMALHGLAFELILCEFQLIQ